MTQSFPARVVSVGKNAAWVVLDVEQHPRVADFKRVHTGTKRSMVVPGDRVDVQLLEDGRALVDRVHERASMLQRRTSEGRARIMAANVDTMVTVTALNDPPPRPLILDQLLAFAQLEDVDAIVIFTKPDLVSDAESQRFAQLYGSLGYHTLVVNPKSGENIAQLRSALTSRHALLCGISGVGKSSIFRALGGEAAVGQISRKGYGRATTRAARLLRLPDGFLIDSPGVAEFGLGDIQPRELVPAFREMPQFSQRCRFTDCSHLHEPDCAVLQAVEAGQISAGRYGSYRSILSC